MFATVANAVLWLWTTVGVAVELLFQVIPASLGLVQTIDAGLARTLFSWTLHAIVYFWLIPAYIAFYTIVPRAAGGRLYSDTMGRLTFILFLLYSLPVGMHHLMMDPEHGNGWKFIQVLLTAFVSVPTLLTIFTITASLEIAGRLRGGRGVFGWIAALPWDRPAVLATGLAFVMLGFGGFGGLINMGYGMNAMVHNTSWVTAHFHLIFGGSVVIMYFAIAYEIWPRLTGREHASPAPLRLQLWLWFIGMMVMTLPWHWLGLQGQWRRVANFNYADPIIAGWGPLVIVSLAGGLVLLASALLFVRNLAVLHRSPLPALQRPLYALAVRSAAARSRRAQRLWALECAGPCADAAGLRLPDRPVHDCAVAGSDGASGLLGARDGALIRVRTSCSRSAMADLGQHRRFRRRAQRRSSGRADHSRGAGTERRDRRLHRHLPGAWHLARIARARSRLSDRTPPTPVSQVVWTPEVLQILADAKPERGLAKAQEVCVACHGEQGVSATPEYPHLAGQSGAAIYKQLNDYRTGSRTNQLMTDIAKALDEATLADVAAYYAAQPKRNPNPATLADSPPEIVRLVELGDPSRNIPPCAACHRPGSGGPIETPILSEQWKEYVALQLKMYATGDRRNDVYGRMREIASKLTPAEINGLATYYRAGFR